MRVHRSARQQAIRPAAPPRPRRAAAAGVLAVGGLLVAALAAPVAAQAARPAQVTSLAQAAMQAAPATTSVGKAKFTVSPATDIKVQENKSTAITVTGTGLDPRLALEIAVCQRDSDVPQDLTQCLGGPIPDENATTSWAVISSNQDGTPPGPVQGAIDDSGKFSVTLQLPGIADAAADCQAAECSVVIRDQSSDQGLLVPVTFDAPGGAPSESSSTPAASTSPSSTTPTSTTPTSTTPTSTTPTSTTPTTPTTPTTTAPVPTTVDAASILVPRVRAGASQVVVFDGFTPGESIAASVAGNPQVRFPALTADDNGLVRVEWAVPADFPAARYSLRVEGSDSLRVGVADFQVLAIIVAPSSASSASSVSAPSSTPSSTPSATSSASSTASSTTASSTSDSSTSSAASSSTAVSTTDSAGGPVTTSSTPWWLWITLGLLLIAGLVVAAVLMGRQHRQQALKEQQARERQLASAAEAQSLLPMPPTPALPTPPAGLGEYAEDPQRPILFSHRQAESYSPPTDPIGDAPTQQIDPRGLPTQAIGPQPGSGSAREPMADPGPATGAWTPDFATGQPPADPGPGTQQFNPFADDADPSVAPAAPATGPTPDPGPGTQQFDPFADEADPDRTLEPDAGGEQTPPKHSADDWDTPPPPR